LPTTVAASPRAQRTRLTLHESTDAERERDLIERARGGDRDAFGALVRLHLPAAIRLSMQVVRNAADAEDVVQDAFLAALKHIDDFQPGRAFWPWLARIVVNRGIDLIGSRSVRDAVPLSPDLRASAPSPLRSAERSELVEHIRRVVSTMPPRQRLVVEMFDLEGASVGEIAELTGSAPATVRWHLHVGRRTLRTALSHLYGGTDESEAH
jgi:RNA polymerase sigma-70 factor (ECF subfamily)